MAVDRAAAAEEAPVSHSEDFKMKMHEVLRSDAMRREAEKRGSKVEKMMWRVEVLCAP